MTTKIGIDPFGNTITIEQQQRRQGLYIIGSTGRGKTVLLENLIMQEITQGIGICVLDPHRDLTRRIIELMPVNRLQDVILLDIANNDYAFGLNLYSSPTQSVKDIQYAIERIMHIWERLFNISRLTPQMVQYMRKCAETLIPNPGYTMAEIPRLFDDIPFRNKLLANVTDPNVLRFWQRHDAKPKIDKSRETDAILNKLDEFLTGMVIPIVGQSKSTLDFRTLMDTRPGKIILVQLDPNLDSITSLIGSMIVALVRNSAFSRENILQNKRKHFSVYADEFDRFATLDFKSIMDECRKYGVAATIAHQTRDVLHRDIPGLVRSTLQGNLVVFQITSPDAEELAGNFDTTPPPAPPEEIGLEEIRTPVKDVVHYLLNNGSHPNDVVNRFAVHTLPKIKELQDIFLYQLNELLYEAMIHQKFDLSLPISRLQHFWQQIEELYPFKQFYPIPFEYRQNNNFIPWDYTTILQGVGVLWTEQAGSSLWHQWVNYLDIAERTFIRDTRLNLINNEGLFSPFWTDIERQCIQVWKAYNPRDFDHDIETELQQQKTIFLNFLEELKSVMHALAKEPVEIGSGQWVKKMKPGTVRPYADIKNDIANQLSGLSVLHAYTRVGGDVQACWSCGAQPTNPNPNFCQSCGKKLKPEYHLTITPSSQGLPKRDVDARIAEIIQRNVADRYLRKRSDVLAEIQARQQPPPPPAAPQPAIPPKPPPTPAPTQQAVQPPAPPKAVQNPPPLPQARRKVPKPKVCASCQTANNPVAIFCMQCGKQL